MDSRWAALSALFIARLGMGFQYQTIAAATPLLRSELGLGLDQIGFLIGIYFVTGLALAVPGAALGARFGEKRTVLFGVLLMVLGGVLAAANGEWPAQVVARILAGTGGVLMNVVMTKMVADWFAGKEIATAMAIFVNSWPVGIALSLVATPLVAETGGLAAVNATSAALCGLGGLLLALLYRDPPRDGQGGPIGVASFWPAGPTAMLVTLAGLVWAFFNSAFAMIFSFGPAMLVEKGSTDASAGLAVSLVLWLSIISVPLGGVLADRLRSPIPVIWCSATLVIAGIVAVALTPPAILSVGLLGMIIGLPAGPILCLPSALLEEQTRAKGMALFYLAFYLVMVLAPIVAGRIAGTTGHAQSAFQSGAWLMVAGLACLATFQVLRWWVARSPARPHARQANVSEGASQPIAPVRPEGFEERSNNAFRSSALDT
jgi:MFS family permease